MYKVQYRCLYREYWYDDLDGVDWPTAAQRLAHLFQANNGQRRLRIVDESTGSVLYDTSVAVVAAGIPGMMGT